MDESDQFLWASTAISNYGTLGEFLTRDTDENNNNKLQVLPSRPQGSFASFICHVYHLERRLRSFSPIVLNNSSNIKIIDKVLGRGKTFLVRQASWVKDSNLPPVDVALKEIIPKFDHVGEAESPSINPQAQGNWKDILFEIRALLHEPIRYHPNLVRLLGIQWGMSPLSDSAFPQLLMEYSSAGNFRALQESVEPLDFRSKQTLCYDVSRGLAALHASEIVHGDMKHENVLVFPRSDATGVKYLAKLADFGGSVMDITSEEFQKIETATWPFQAPEWNNLLDRQGMMLTDVYSFGLLVWRAFMDGEGYITLRGASQIDPDEEKRELTTLKETEGFTKLAVDDVSKYADTHGIPRACLEVIIYTLLHTIRAHPGDRSLVKAQSALRGIKLGKVEAYLDLIRAKNVEHEANQNSGPPGQHGVTVDALSIMLGRYGESVDLQDNLPGYRPSLDSPSAGEFAFEPSSLKAILTWAQQQQIVEEFKEAAKPTGNNKRKLLEMIRTKAAFYLFQCYLWEFGVVFDAEQAVKWLEAAASDDDRHEIEDYLAQAWIWRISNAFNINNTIPGDRTSMLLKLSVIRGHRTALQDLLRLASTAPDSKEWMDTYWKFRNIFQSQMAAVGVGYFFESKLIKSFNMEDLTQLDEQLRRELGDDYQRCLRPTQGSLTSLVERLKAATLTNNDEEKTAFDKIYLNIRGHGLLHYAAATGNLIALRHMVTKYKCNIDLPNQHVDETPLLCASAGGKLECASFLLEHGADPNGWRFSQEGPLHWLCSFLPHEMETIAVQLISAGADIERRAGGMRHDVRDIKADWEHHFELAMTPLGRAVLMNNTDAVRVLLKLGANPLAKTANKHPGEYQNTTGLTQVVDVRSPFELAAVLTLPEILAQFIQHIDQGQANKSAPKLKLIDETDMLHLAHACEVTKFDPLTLQSRLARCGKFYVTNARLALALLYGRSLPWTSDTNEEVQERRARALCKEVALGNVDIVESLLGFKGYPVNGTKNFRPVENAIELNHYGLFALLARHGANLKVTRTTPEGQQLSLLHLCALKPHHSRPGSTIARHLISAGLPVESADSETRSPLSLAVANQNFDIATALLENGANVDATYPIKSEGPNGVEIRIVNVLAEVLGQHVDTTRTLDSLKFLLGKGEGGPSSRPSFILDKSNMISVLHLLAGSKHYTEIAQITPSIVDLCLDTYSEPSQINYRHPVLGTPLYHAAANGQKPMVERLLRKGAHFGFETGPDISSSVKNLLRPKETWTPLWAAILRYDEEINRCILFPKDGTSEARLQSNLIQNLEKIVQMLSAKAGDALASEAINQLTQKRGNIIEKYNDEQKTKRAFRMEYREDPSATPIDLSILGRNPDKALHKAIDELPEGEWLGKFRGSSATQWLFEQS